MKSGASTCATVNRAVMNEQFWVPFNKTVGCKISEMKMLKGTLLRASAVLQSSGVV